MAEVIATKLLQIVFDKLASKAISKYAELIGIDEELRKLERTLLIIQAELKDAETRQVKEETLKIWLRELKDLAYDADDVLDDFAYKAAKLKPGTESHMKDKVRNFFNLPKKNKIAQRVKEINKRLNEIAEVRSKFHLKKEEVAGGSSKIESSTISEETGSYKNKSEVYGRDEDKEKIVEFLLNTSIGGDIGVIGIVGLGGIGKTTLAQLVYNDESVCRHFEKKMWVCVSEEFEINRLLRLIIESATEKEFLLRSIDAMQKSLKEQLKEKRFLLVLDDVWSEDHGKWDRLRSLLEVGDKGSKIIVTTRSKQVASIMGAIPLYRLSSLSLDDCWLLFERRAFPIGVERNPKLVSIGREIVKKCGGVPLAAEALGSLLRSKRSESVWQAIKDSEIWKFSENDILPGSENCKILSVLKLSYDHLLPCLKQCFAYCSIFPKDYMMYTDNLVKLWGAEGFLKPYDEHMHWEQIGLQYVDELLERSLFQKKWDGCVTMHDLVHDLAQSVAGDECSIVDATTGGYLSQNSRYAYFIDNNDEQAFQSLRDAKKLRTLYFRLNNGTGEADNEKRKEERAQEVVHVISSNLNFLRALHLRGYPLKALPDSFKKLKHLRYLALSNKFESFPPCINTLHNLQTLDLSCTLIKSIPDSIANLHSLCTLDLSKSGIESLPESICTLSNLHTLNLKNCFSFHELPQNMSNMKNLHTLDLSWSKIESLPESICTLSNLHTLNLKNCSSFHELPQNMSNMKSLYTLDLSNSGIESLPESICTLSNLHTLNLTDCSSIHELPQNMSNMKSLYTLDLSNSRIESLPESTCTLSNLHTLNLKKCSSFHELPQNMSNMKSLYTLNLSNSGIESLPESICTLSNLHTLNLHHCSSFHELPQSMSNMKNLYTLDLSSTKIESLPESICTLSNLHTLNLKDCFCIHELPQNMSNMKSLVHLNIRGCQELTCIPRGLGKLNRLRTLPIFIVGGKTNCSLEELGSMKLEGELEIRELQNVRNIDEAKGANLSNKHSIRWLILSWDQNSYKNPEQAHECDKDDEIVKIQHAEDVLQCLQPSKSLEALLINGYVGRTFPFWMMESSLSNLLYLTLSDCFYCERIPAFGLPQLKVLSLESLPLIKHLGSDFYGEVNLTGLEEWCSVGSEQLFPCLKILALNNCPKLKALRLDLSSVISVHIEGCDSLRVFNSFPSLKRLRLIDLTGLEELCSVGSEQLFPCLLSLTLNNCPKLKALPSDLSSVRSVRIEGCDWLRVFNAFPSLNRLRLRDLAGLEELCSVGSEQLFPCLERLVLKNCPKLKALPSVFNAFPSLKELELSNLTGLEEWCSVGSEQLFPCLKRLYLSNCPKLKALPSDFSSVQTVRINGYECLSDEWSTEDGF